MDVELYNQLHGISQNILKKPIKNEFQRDIDDYIDLTIEEEKNNFQEGFETVSQQITKRRKELNEAINTFNDNFSNGYKVLIEFLKEIDEKIPEINEKNIKIL